MAERFTAKQLREHAGTISHIYPHWSGSTGNMLEQAAATEDALVKFRRFLFEADDTDDGWNACLRAVEVEAQALGLWCDPEGE